MFVHASLKEGVREKAILEPKQGRTRKLKGEPTALVGNAEGKVEERILVVDRAVGNRWLVNKGLNENDKLITEGLQYVRVGMQVEVQPANNVGPNNVATGGQNATGTAGTGSAETSGSARN